MFETQYHRDCFSGAIFDAEACTSCVALRQVHARRAKSTHPTWICWSTKVPFDSSMLTASCI